MFMRSSFFESIFYYIPRTKIVVRSKTYRLLFRLTGLHKLEMQAQNITKTSTFPWILKRFVVVAFLLSIVVWKIHCLIQNVVYET